MMDQFDELTAEKNFPWKIREILPGVLVAGEDAGVLTEEGAKLLDPTGTLQSQIPMCPPEGDAGTGMVATNSVAVRTGNVSAGTSVFAMAVLPLQIHLFRQIHFLCGQQRCLLQPFLFRHLLPEDTLEFGTEVFL